MSEIIYSEMESGELKIQKAELLIRQQGGFGKSQLWVVAVGEDKTHAQIQIHSQLQDVYEKIGDAIEKLRDEIQ